MNAGEERSRGIGDAALVLRWIRANALEAFTLRECQQRLRGRFRKAAQLEPGIARVVPPPKVGRPPRLFRVVDAGANG